MELKKVLESFGLSVVNLDELSDEELQSMIDEQVKKQNEHINTLESEKDSLSKANEELTTSVEGYKSSEEKLTKELSETRDKLTASEAKLSQITELYKENFTKDPEEQESHNSDKEFHDDVLAQILDTK